MREGVGESEREGGRERGREGVFGVCVSVSASAHIFGTRSVT